MHLEREREKNVCYNYRRLVTLFTLRMAYIHFTLQHGIMNKLYRCFTKALLSTSFLCVFQSRVHTRDTINVPHVTFRNKLLTAKKNEQITWVDCHPTFRGSE